MEIAPFITTGAINATDCDALMSIRWFVGDQSEFTPSQQYIRKTESVRIIIHPIQGRSLLWFVIIENLNDG